MSEKNNLVLSLPLFILAIILSMILMFNEKYCGIDREVQCRHY